MSKEFKLFLMILLILAAGYLSNKIIITGKFYIVGEERENGVTIISSPNQAEVYFDDAYVGRSPVTITELSPGTHKVVLKKLGYYDLTEYVDLGTNQRKDVFYELQSSFGKVYVESDPTNADVFIDGLHKGITPKLISDLSDGAHILILVKEGYVDYTDYVISGKQEKKVFIKLDRKTREAAAQPLFSDRI